MTHNVAVFGEALFDMIEQKNGDYRPYIGGSPYNVATSFSRQEIHCTYLSPISTDEFGQQIYQSVKQENINVPANNRSSKPTSLALVYTDQYGQPDYRLYRTSVADLDISADKLLELLPTDIKLFHTGSLALVPEMQEVLLPVIQQMKAKGIKISIDVNIRKGVEENQQRYISAVSEFVKLADIVKVSDEDLILQGLTKDPKTHAQEILETMNNGIVVLTLGAHGAHVITQNIDIHQPIFQPENFGDTVGAGDTFFSAMLSQLLRDNALSPNSSSEQLAYALKFGALAASMNVANIGCHPPNFTQVNDAMSEFK